MPRPSDTNSACPCRSTTGTLPTDRCGAFLPAARTSRSGKPSSSWNPMRSRDRLSRLAAPPEIAAVVSTYNRATLLTATLESLTRQTLSPGGFEVVIVDDGSTDDTRKVVETFAARLPVTYAYQRNAGLASARTHG